MGLRSGSAWLTLYAMVIGTAPAWALAPHDRIGGPREQQLVNEHAQTAQNESVPRTNERGTPDRPLIVKTITVEKSPQEAAQDRKERKDKKWYDRFGVVIGVINGAIFLLQTLVFGFQAYIFRGQAQSLRDTITAMQTVGKQQSDDMQSSIAAAQAAAVASSESASLARLALEAAETPFLMINITPGELPIDPNGPVVATSVVAFYRFENCGRSPANVLEVRLDSSFGVTTPQPAFFPPLNTVHGGSYILPQGKCSEPLYLRIEDFDGWTYSDIANPAWINGHIRYSDVFGNQFLTRFSFYRNAKNGRWMPQGGAGHNGRFRLTGDDLVVARARDRGEYLILQTANAKP